MPRDNDKDNDSRGRRDRPPGAGGRHLGAKHSRPGAKSRSGAARGPEKKFAKRGFGAKGEGDKRPYRGNREDRPLRRDNEAPRHFGRDDRPSRGDGQRGFKPRGDRPNYARDDRPPHRDRGEARPAGPFSEKKFGDKRPYRPRGDGFQKDGDHPRGDRPYSRDRNSEAGDRPQRGGEKSFSRGPRKEFGGRAERGRDRGDEKPWQKHDDRPRTAHRGDERPRFSRPRQDRDEGGRPFRERPRFDRPRERTDDREKLDRPHRDRNRDRGDREGRQQRSEGGAAWREHPRSERRSPDGFTERPRRDSEDDSKIFAKRPAFGGRGAYRERPRESDKRRASEEAKPKKAGERIAKVLARSGLASRRDAEEWIVQGRVSVNGRVINSPALDVTANDMIAVDGKPLPARERTRLFLYHKPRGLMTTHADPEGRPTVFDNLPEGLPRLISVGRLDFNTEGLLLLTNDGGLARVLELPETGWLRRYRVRAHGEITQVRLDELKDGVDVDGVKYGPIEAKLERDQGANVWLVFAIREGKNREVRNVLAHLGLEVNRLIRTSYGPFQLGELAEGAVEEIKTRVLREQLGDKIVAQAGCDFAQTAPTGGEEAREMPRSKKPFQPAGKSALIADRKGRRILVERSGSEEARARNEEESRGYGPPRRPKRGYHGKRDLKPRQEQD